ncbi:MAG: succinate dehydrogenase, cytochrome b556 subunit [Pseudomonadota bacterium]|uniref:succinate dehydrogenase, cytochrome b556 subunit n=1 Tax=unclassified Phenylobacterium TaxID=2640670 RepID=UPI0006FA81F2|nr:MULTISPECIES: succinate dehydrogenase, cytochrome b556 subunit [unclassified Phenylobacterium]KRB51122.1 succinate dehydrogenase [Phenylobacterium sp. Root700]MBT9471550.1 succinate dehydrogenase, cytochrome b556 subunit [Phenylobacterium sp.]
MTDAPRERPLSPHTTIWRWHLTMATSILHRASGCALYGGGLILAIWAMTLAAGPEAYGMFKAVMGSPLGKVVMFGMTLATFYHLAKGIQHLIWDAGHGYNLKTATMGAIATIAFAIAATLAVWIIAGMTGAL